MQSRLAEPEAGHSDPQSPAPPRSRCLLRRVPTTRAAREYRGPLENDLRLEAFSRHTLIALLNEISLQGHLLTLSFADAVESRTDPDRMKSIASQRFTGIAGVAAGRLKRALGFGSRLEDIASVFDLHPAFHPRSYIDVRIAQDDGISISLHDCPAIGDGPGRSWADELVDGRRRARSMRWSKRSIRACSARRSGRRVERFAPGALFQEKGRRAKSPRSR